MVADQTKSNVNISTPDQEIHQTKKLKGPIPDKKTFNKKEFMWKDKFSFYFSKSFYIEQIGRIP
jgi:hypothetical protein